MFLELFPILDACFSWIKGKKVKGQGHLKVRFDFNSNIAKILYGWFGGTIDTLCVIIGKIFILHCGETVEVRLIEVGGRVKILFIFHSKMNLN